MPAEVVEENHLFSLLGVLRSSNEDEIKECWKQLYAKAADDASRKKLNNAKTILLDPSLRMTYIAKLVSENNNDGLDPSGGLNEIGGGFAPKSKSQEADEGN